MLDATDLRAGFQLVQIGSLVEAVRTATPASAVEEDEFTYVDLSAIDQAEKTIIGARKVPCAEAPSRARQVIRHSDVLVSTVRPNLNGVALVPEELDEAIASTGFCVLRPKVERLHPRYLFHWVRTPRFVDDMVRQATGASYPAVTDRIVHRSRIPLPTLAEQRRLAAILDEADALRAKRRAALAQLDEMARAIFVEMFGPSPYSDTIALADCVEEFRYGTSEKSTDAGHPTLRIPNVIGGAIDLEDLKLVPVGDAEFRRLQLRASDVLFVRTNGNPEYVGRCAAVPENLGIEHGFKPDAFIYASYLIRARLYRQKLDPSFLCSFLATEAGRKQVREHAKTSAGQFNINIEGLGAIRVPAASLRAQQAFAERLRRIAAIQADQMRNMGALDTLFASLQHRAFRGEL